MVIRPNILKSDRLATETEVQRKRSTLLTVAAIACLCLGSASPLAGLFIIIVHTLIPNDKLFNSIGTFLMIVSIPFLLAGSHLLDVIAKHH